MAGNIKILDHANYVYVVVIMPAIISVTLIIIAQKSVYYIVNHENSISYAMDKEHQDKIPQANDAEISPLSNAGVQKQTGSSYQTIPSSYQYPEERRMTIIERNPKRYAKTKT